MEEDKDIFSMIEDMMEKVILREEKRIEIIERAERLYKSLRKKFFEKRISADSIESYMIAAKKFYLLVLACKAIFLSKFKNAPELVFFVEEVEKLAADEKLFEEVLKDAKNLIQFESP